MSWGGGGVISGLVHFHLQQSSAWLPDTYTIGLGKPSANFKIKKYEKYLFDEILLAALIFKFLIKDFP